MESYYLYIIIILIILIVFYCCLCSLGNKLLFHPAKCTSMINNKFNDMEVENGYVKTIDGVNIHYIYIINPKSDLVFLHAHGNGGNISSRFQCETIKYLLKYGSVCMFDYRGFGKSSGSPYEKGLYIDARTMWTHLTEDKKIDHDNIILVGTSLGCSIVSKLGADLCSDGEGMPKLIIMQSGFYDIKDISSKLLGSWAKYACYLIGLELDNHKNIRKIKDVHQDYPILILHSKSDELIPYTQSKKLSKDTNSIMIEIDGTHNCAVINDDVDKEIAFHFDF